MPLLVSKFKQDYEFEHNSIESEIAKLQRQGKFLEQMDIVANWVLSFDPNRVNDCFDNSYNVVPRELQPKY